MGVIGIIGAMIRLFQLGFSQSGPIGYITDQAYETIRFKFRKNFYLCRGDFVMIQPWILDPFNHKKMWWIPT